MKFGPVSQIKSERIALTLQLVCSSARNIMNNIVCAVGTDESLLYKQNISFAFQCLRCITTIYSDVNINLV